MIDQKGFSMRLMNSILFCAALLVSLAPGADALLQTTLGCETVWKYPASNNSVFTCLADSTRIGNHWRWYIPAALAAAMVILLLLIFPIFFILRQVCHFCGSNIPRPGECCVWNSKWDAVDPEELKKEYPLHTHVKVKVASYIVVLVAFAALIMMVSGAGMVSSSSVQVFRDVINVISQFQSIKQQVVSYLTDWQSATGYVANFDPTCLNEIDSWVSMAINTDHSYSDKTSQYRSQIQIGVNIISAAPLLLLLLTPFLAVFDDCRSFFPAFISVFYYLASLVFGLLAVLFFVVAYGLNAVSGEIQAHKSRQPGIIEWYLVPTCNEKLLPKMLWIDSNISQAELSATTAACNIFNQRCSGTATYNPSNPNVLFECDSFSVPTCSDVTTGTALSANDFFEFSSAKNGANPCNGLSQADCTMYTCAYYCSDTQLKSDMTAARSYLYSGTSCALARYALQPLLSCDSIADIVVGGAGQVDNTASGLWLLGAGAIVAQILLICGIVLLFRGQKVFFKPLRDENENEHEPSRV